MLRREHLKISREILGLAGNPAIHDFLDALPPHLHRLTHNIGFIEREIEPYFGRDGVIEAWAHIMADWGFFDGIIQNKTKKKEKNG
jgi:hypothetical protein